MNRYERTFARLKAKSERAFIPFAVAGDPDLPTSERIFRAYIDGGADILEIGYPFSDPVADGPVNQRAAQRAISSGLTHDSFFALVKRLRRTTDVPFGLLCYANSVIHRGIERFCRDAAAAGLDSMLVADLPPEESGDFQKSMRRHGLGRIFIVSELTPAARMRFIASQVDSFVYVVSRLGTTGVHTSLSESVASTLRRLKRITGKPLAVGFGISKPKHVMEVCKAGADAAIVGSALVAMIEENLDKKSNLPRLLAKRTAEYKAATLQRGARNGKK